MKTKMLMAAAAPLAALSLTAAPAAAQDYRYDRDRDRNDSTRDALIGAAVGAVAGAVIGQGDGTYILGGALAGAAVGATANGGDDCGFYRDGRCWRNQGHWERENGIDRNRYGYQAGYGYDQRYVDGRTYQGRGYWRDGRFWRNHGEWRSAQNRQDRDWRYDRRW